METLSTFKKEETTYVQKVQKTTPWLLLIGIILIAVNMRAPLTSIGPLVEMIRDQLYLSNTMAGLITTIPLIMFAIFSPFVPNFAERFGINGILFIASLLIMFGIFMRAIFGTSSIILYTGTAILGIGIAACNVLMPSLVKREFPNQIGLMTGVYSISMNLFGGIASGISIPVAVGLNVGWQGALGIWGLLSLLGVLFWIPQMKRNSSVTTIGQTHTYRQKQNMWRSPLAWQVTLFMGLQSTLFYCLIAWLPEILNYQGLSANQSGWMLALMQAAVLPITFITPILASQMKNQFSIVMITFITNVVGLLGLLFGSTKFVFLWVCLIGCGVGLAFGLAMILFNLRTKTSREAAELSGMAQSFGYVLAAIGPMFLGYLYDVTNGWTVPLYVLIATSVMLFIVGMGASRDKFVGDEK